MVSLSLSRGKTGLSRKAVRRLRVCGLFLLAGLIGPWTAAPDPAAAQSAGAAVEGDQAPPGQETRVGASGLAIPRFVSLRANVVNMRTGPGMRYPIEWVYQREGLPVQVVDEFEAWRRVRDRDGTVGWIHRAMLSKRRTAVVTAALVQLRAEPDAASEALAMLEAGLILELDDCDGDWCRVTLYGGDGGSYDGWLPAPTLWGVGEGSD